MTSVAEASTHVRRLTGLTTTLTDRLETETRAFSERRPQDIVQGLNQTQEMANLYRRETAQLKANPDLAASAPLEERLSLIRATERFETVLAQHSTVVQAARIVSEGIVQAVAVEVAAARTAGAGYGANGQAAYSDGTAITLNRSA